MVLLWLPMVKYDSVGYLLPSNSRLLMISLAITLGFVFLLCWFFEPRWETNDDISMSMVAHGYGIAASGSPNIMFSNVLWGNLVRTIPAINGILGYSIATLGVLVIVGTVVVYGLSRLDVNYVTSLSVFALILVRPVLFPQFTINAGLLLLAAIICWYLYAQHNDWRTMMVGCLLAFCSYLVRSQEFLLVLIVALPILPWSGLLLHRTAKTSITMLIVAITIAAVINHQAYQGDEWKSFNALNPARAPFTDLGAGEHLKQHPDILSRHGYSSNDIDLISDWFFVDSKIANPKALSAMLDELGPLPAQGNAITDAWIGVQTLWHPNLLASILAALLLFLLRPYWSIAASWVLFILAVFTLGLLGRPGILRVYVPLVCLLLVVPFLRLQYSDWRNRMGVTLLFVSAVVNTTYVFSESRTSQAATEQIRQQVLATFPSYPVVVWGATFPFEAVYPVLGEASSAMTYKLYGLGVSTLAPFSVAFAEQKNGHGLITLLVSKNALPILVYSVPKTLINYCLEHFHGQLKELPTQEYGVTLVRRLRCE